MDNCEIMTCLTRKELLLECWAEQRLEVTYRRNREQLIFQTSAYVWLAILGALVVNAQIMDSFLFT